jgi:adenylate cyclase
VNLASRIEGINKYFGTSIIVTEETKKELAGGNFNLLSLGSIKAAGKDEPVKLFTLLETALDADLKKIWEDALSAFKNKNWSEALAAFKSFGDQVPSLMKSSELYIKQISHLQSSPLPDNWQGEITFQKAHRGAGVVFIFPSYMMHRVTKVTRGVRRSFVLWVGGCTYK